MGAKGRQFVYYQKAGNGSELFTDFGAVVEASAHEGLVDIAKYRFLAQSGRID